MVNSAAVVISVRVILTSVVEGHGNTTFRERHWSLRGTAGMLRPSVRRRGFAFLFSASTSAPPARARSWSATMGACWPPRRPPMLRLPRRNRCGPNNSPPTGGARPRRRSGRPWPRAAWRRTASRRSASRGRCTAPSCSTMPARSCGRRSSGATSAARPSVEWLTNEIGRERLLELTSNPALTNFTLTKLIWVRRHEPAAWARVRHVLLPKDYVRFRLSGEYATDVADASGTLLLDVARRVGRAMSWRRRTSPPRCCRRYSNRLRFAPGCPQMRRR